MMGDPVTICVCTFRRASVFDTLQSFEALRGVGGLREPGVSVVVIDNDDTDILRSAVEEVARTYRYCVRYVHAPAKNISIARNAALDSVESRWLLFIDDDETADPDWLTRIIAYRDRADMVIGQCIATYSASLPVWAQRCDFHSNRITGNVENAYTSNALIDMEFVRKHGLRFRAELGTTGGEDTVFFREAAEAGAKIVYAPDAVVLEPVPPGRANMVWVKRRMYRAGQTHGLVCQEFDPAAFRWLLLTAGAKAAASVAMAAISGPGSDRSRRWIARSYLHAGAVHYRVKPQILQEYG